MIISQKSKIIFIHIQRTGGSSTINLLKKHLGNDLEIVSQHGNSRSKEGVLLNKHSDYFTFSFVRNPWARLWSWYLLINKGTLMNKEDKKLHFENFLTYDLAFQPNDPYFHYNQLDYISDEDGSLFTDKIYRFENYANEIQSLQKDLSLPEIEVQHMNPSKDLSYQEYYTRKSRELIHIKCKKDIDYFNYSF